MKKFSLFLVLTLLTGLLGRVANSWQDDALLHDEAERIQNTIRDLDAELQAYLSSSMSSGVNLSEHRGLWDEKSIGLVVYQRNEAVHWTTNAFPFPSKYNERQSIETGIVRLKNSWYLCRAVELDGETLAAYGLLRTGYDFENRYIQNQWSNQINANNRFDLTKTGHRDFDLQLSGNDSGVGLRVSDPINEQAPLSAVTLIWLVFILLLLATLWYSANWISELSGAFFGNVVFAALVVILRVLMIWWQLPSAIYGLELFDPTQHATSTVIPSLGDLILHLLCLLLIVARVARTSAPTDNKYLSRFLGISLPVVLVIPINYVFQILVVNSSFSLDLNSPFSLDEFSVLGLVVSFITILIYNTILRWLYSSFKIHAEKPTQLFVWLLIGGVVLLTVFGLEAWPKTLVSTLVVGLLLFTQSWFLKRGGVSAYTPIIFAYSVLACVILTDATTENEHENRVAIADKLDRKQNPITEYLFDELAQEIRADRKLRLALNSGNQNATESLAILHRILSYDHWNTYTHHLDVFNKDGGLMLSDRERTGPNYFELQAVYEKAQPTISDNLKYVGSWSAQGGYLARIELKTPRKDQVLILFVSLIPEKTDDILGFTDLFVDEEYSTAQELEGYSYALYLNSELQDRKGAYAYGLTDKAYDGFQNETTCFDDDGYSHLVSRPMEGRLVVVSKPSIGFLNYLTTFSYLFLFYLCCTFVTALFSGKLSAVVSDKQSFRTRINLAMSSVSFISLILIGVLTVVYVIREYNARNQEMISEKSQSVLIELEHKLRDRRSFEESDKTMLSALMVKFSKVFFTDINLYHMDGHLLATSRPRLFDEGLMADVMDPVAYEEMRFGQRSAFIHEETIGNLNYLTAYVPFRNDKREVIAFMSLPYFARQYGLQQEIFALLATLTNIYVFLILISVVLALVISNRITEPLRFIRESLRNLKLDQANRSIDWKSNDEIGELVDEYNRTLNELVHSAELLAKSERESAWREMAKQVAHEIKNPLTPMKLSIQMLQRSMADGAGDLNERIERTSKTLIEQIDTLSNIATEFSSFAQMPKSVVEEMNLVNVLRNVSDLHKNSEVAVSLELNGIESAKIQADKEQMLRVLTNLVKNGIQAIDNPTKGKVKVGLVELKNDWIISVSDNGSGIPEDLQDKIFVPNFTTKTSGMGLGLAMVKNIVESANGNISFVSEIGSGTTFKVSLPREDARK